MAKGLKFEYMDCTILVTKKKDTVKLICSFVFAYAKTRFSHDAAHITQLIYTLSLLFRLSIVVRVEKVDLYYIFVKLKIFSLLACFFFKANVNI